MLSPVKVFYIMPRLRKCCRLPSLWNLLFIVPFLWLTPFQLQAESLTQTVADSSQSLPDTLQKSPLTMGRNSGVPEIDSLPLHDWKLNYKPLSYSKTLAFSTVFPGGGQYFSGHYVRASFLLALEGALLASSLNGLNRLEDERKLEKKYFNEASLYLESPEKTSKVCNTSKECISKGRTSRDIYMQQADLMRAQITWAIGLHFYGFLDAFEIARESRRQLPDSVSPRRAFFWGLVIPGAGQWINGRYGKFGMLWMALGASSLSIIHRQEMVEYFQKRINFAKAEGISELTKLEEKATLFRKRRNQYFWGIALLYLYSLGDAVVDASLSDFDHPNKFAINLGTVQNPLGLTLTYTF